MNWNNDTELKFLEEYQIHAVIWDPDHPHHKIKQKKDEAWDKIRENLDVPCTVHELKKKKESLMSAYRHWRTKVKNSERSGDVYQPGWWAYSLMDSFLGDIYTPNSTGTEQQSKERRSSPWQMPMDNSAKCRCCLSRPPNKQLDSKHTWRGKCEVYAVMLKKCFDIQLKLGVVDGDAGICDMCVVRLRDALSFKQQVLQCQEEFEAAVNKPGNVKDERTTTTKIKIEGIEETAGDSIFAELKSTDEHSRADNYDASSGVKRESSPGEEAAGRGCKKAPRKKVVGVVAKSGGVLELQPIQIDRPQRSRPSHAQRVSSVGSRELPECKRLQFDAALLFRHSNATPFLSKSIKGLECLFCRETLPTMAALREHTHNKHENNKIPFSNVTNKLYLKMDILDLQCKLCHTHVDLLSNLQTHLTEKHGIVFKSVKNYILEFKLTDAETMKCARCDSTFETFKVLQHHMGKHYKNYVCEVCAAGFINAHLLQRHRRSHENGAHKCHICDKIFKSVTNLGVHRRTHSKLDVKCPHCAGTFNSYYTRNSHMLKVHKIAAATYRCNVCDRNFVMKSGLTVHIKKDHLMERNHICPVCGNGFFKRRGLEQHLITHGADKVYQCAVCCKTYPRKETLSRHMKMHTDSKSLQCGVCGVKFAQKCSLKGHMMSSHGLTLADCDSEGGVYTCKRSLLESSKQSKPCDVDWCIQSTG